MKEEIRQAVIELLEDIIQMIGGEENGTNHNNIKQYE